MSFHFDCNATTALRDCAREVWLAASREAWANPSALYPSALEAKALLEESRERIAALLACSPGRVVFTSGATESNNAFFRRFEKEAARGARCAISSAEHASVSAAARALFGERTLLLPVTADGCLDMAAAEEIIRRERPVAVSVVAACSETGALQPWREVAKICRECGGAFHCDAVQLLGRLPLGDLAAQCPYATFSAHKAGGPRGVGLLVAPAEDNLLSLQYGGAQESARRAGTENVAAIAAAAAALAEALAEASSHLAEEQARRRDRFEARVKALGAKVAGEGAPRLPQTSMLLLARHSNLAWVSRLGKLGFECGTGSACASGKSAPSPILAAMGVPESLAQRAVRVSASLKTPEADWTALADAFEKALAELDRESASSNVVSIE
jgi:cysteine desulfurase